MTSPNSFLDSAFPWLVGHRTELVALTTFVVNVLGAFGVIAPIHVSEVNTAAVPLGAATLLAKWQRMLPSPPVG